MHTTSVNAMTGEPIADASLPSLELVSRDYSFLWPLRAGLVRAASFSLALDIDTADAMNRTRNPEVATAGEFSLARHIVRIAQGDRRIAAVPIFVHRVFPTRAFYSRTDNAPPFPQGLADCRIASQTWTTTGDVWRRLFLRRAGLAPERLEWTTCERSAALARWQSADPHGVRLASTPGANLIELLLAGEVDVVMSSLDHRDSLRSGQIRRLFPEIEELDVACFAEMGYVPPHHCYGIPNHFLAHRKGWLVELYAVLGASRRKWQIRADDPISMDATPWQELDSENARRRLGQSWNCDGIEPNRVALEALVDELYTEGFIDRRVAVEEIFSEFLEASSQAQYPEVR